MLLATRQLKISQTNRTWDHVIGSGPPGSCPRPQFASSRFPSRFLLFPSPSKVRLPALRLQLHAGQYAGDAKLCLVYGMRSNQQGPYWRITHKNLTNCLLLAFMASASGFEFHLPQIRVLIPRSSTGRCRTTAVPSLDPDKSRGLSILFGPRVCTSNSPWSAFICTIGSKRSVRDGCLPGTEY